MRDTIACVRSLERLDYARHRVVVVDNGSTDGSVDHIRAECPSVLVLGAEGNLGFSGGFNAGISRALAGGADLVLLVNSDAMVPPD